MDSAQQILQQQVQDALSSSTPLLIQGGGSKPFYGRETSGKVLSTLDNSGIVAYSPTELVITVKAGTRLSEIVSLLDENNQMLGFEPPAFTDEATIGGVIASGLAGPSRPFNGSVNHFVLGVKILTGKGEMLSFGGQVIKNVAGFDVSRLMVGALGCLGVLLEVSIKVIPQPARHRTIKINHEKPSDSIRFMNQLSGKSVPISAVCWYLGQTYIRFSGSVVGVDAATADISGEALTDGASFWSSIKEQTHAFFTQQDRLLRVSVAPSTAHFGLETNQLIDWGGALRWIPQKEEDVALLENIVEVGGHYCKYRNFTDNETVFSPLNPMVMKLHQNLKNTFDPSRILNPGRMYKEL